jgi:hypothetical protein
MHSSAAEVWRVARLSWWVDCRVFAVHMWVMQKSHIPEVWLLDLVGVMIGLFVAFMLFQSWCFDVISASILKVLAVKLAICCFKLRFRSDQ